jgi:uncharacterized RmlC-like cupin family protein
MSDLSPVGGPDWKNHGLRIVRGVQLDTNTPQTPGMTRGEAISHARVGAQKLWAGTVIVHPNAKTGPHPPRRVGNSHLRGSRTRALSLGK